MTPENFCYWLQGVFEVSNPQELSKEQLDVIKEHLQLVFNKVTINKFGTKLCDSKEFDLEKYYQEVGHCKSAPLAVWPEGPIGSC